MFRLNDPILIPHRDFLRSFFEDEPISGPRPPHQLTPCLLRWWLLCTEPARRWVTKEARCSVTIARTPAVASVLRKFPRNYRRGYCDQWPPPGTSGVSVRPRLAPTRMVMSHWHSPSSINAANIQIAVSPRNEMINFKRFMFWEKMSSFFRTFLIWFLKNSASDDDTWRQCSQYSSGIINY